MPKVSNDSHLPGSLEYNGVIEMQLKMDNIGTQTQSDELACTYVSVPNHIHAVAETAVGPVSVPSQVAWVSVVYIALSSRDCEQSEIRWSRQHDYIASG